MNLIKVDGGNREDVTRYTLRRWFETVMALRGELVDLTTADGFVAYEGEEVVGLIQYRLDGAECEIVLLDCEKSGAGLGTALIDAVAKLAREKGCARLTLITTNDNIEAIRFYQKRGFDMANLYHDALTVSRQIKPSIPEIGEHGIPIRHEIEFVMQL